MPKTGAKKDDQYATLVRRRKVVRLYLEGRSQMEIAEVCQVSQPTVSIDLNWVREQWLKSVIRNYDQLVAEEIAALDHQLEELWKAWYRSCEKEEVKTRSVERELRSTVEEESESDSRKKGRKPLSEMIPIKRTSKVVEKQLIGDPRIMSEITKLRELKAKITGIIKKDEDKTQINVAVLPTGFWESAQGARVESSRIEDKLRELEGLPEVPSSGESLPDTMGVDNVERNAGGD